MNKFYIVRYLFFIVSILFITANSSLAENNKLELHTIKDLKNREITIPKNINKVVALGHGVTRLLVYMDDNGDILNKIAGIDQKDKKKNSPRLTYAYTRPELQKIESIGTGKPFQLDIEKVLKIKPDIIITSPDIDDRLVKKLKDKFNIPVVIIDDGYLLKKKHKDVIQKELFVSLDVLGAIFNKKDKASKLKTYINATLSDVRNRINLSTSKPEESVYIGGAGFNGPQGIFSSRTNNNILNLLSLHNVLDNTSNNSDKQKKIMLDKEKLLVLNPDVIFIDMSGKDVFVNEFYKNKKYFNGLSAFSKRKVFYLSPQEAYGYNIESILINLYFMGSLFYPDEFKDIELNEKYNEITHTLLKSTPVSLPGKFSS